jgi:hypothetical protein
VHSDCRPLAVWVGLIPVSRTRIVFVREPPTPIQGVEEDIVIVIHNSKGITTQLLREPACYTLPNALVLCVGLFLTYNREILDSSGDKSVVAEFLNGRNDLVYDRPTHSDVCIKASHVNIIADGT